MDTMEEEHTFFVENAERDCTTGRYSKWLYQKKWRGNSLQFHGNERSSGFGNRIREPRLVESLKNSFERKR